MTTGIEMTASELVLVDSSRWLEYITGDENADAFEAAFQRDAEVVVPTIALHEVFEILLLRAGKTAANVFLSEALRRRIADVTDTTAILRRSASERKTFAAVLPARRSRISKTSWRAIVGTTTSASLWKAASKASAFSSPVMYSSQREESTSTSSEAVISIPVVILPFHALGDSTQFLDRAWLAESNRPGCKQSIPGRDVNGLCGAG